MLLRKSQRQDVFQKKRCHEPILPFAWVALLRTQPFLSAQVPVIFDTDFGGDADDLGALAMLHYFVDQGECDLLAVMSWSQEQDVIPAIDAVNRFYDHPDVPLGVRKGDPFFLDWHYTHVLADSLPHEAGRIATSN